MPRTYSGPQIALDLERMAFKRDADRQWMKLPEPKLIVLTQRRMKQRGGGRIPLGMHSYNAFCVYIRAGNINILAYQGRRHLVEKEAEKLKEFLNIGIKEIYRRDANGVIIDDDFGESSLSNSFPVIIALIAIIGIVIALLTKV